VCLLGGGSGTCRLPTAGTGSSSAGDAPSAHGALVPICVHDVKGKLGEL
jgi:hypothetical protein